MLFSRFRERAAIVRPNSPISIGTAILGTVGVVDELA